MNKPNTVCRVCGKEYFCCDGRQNVNSWKTMACSPECFKEYMRRIEQSRNPNVGVASKEPKEEAMEKRKPTKKKIAIETEKEENIIEKKCIE